MSFILEDSSSGKWLLGVNAVGQLTTTSASGPSTTIFLNFSGTETWEIGVTTEGLLTTTAVPFAEAPDFITLLDIFGNSWEVSVNFQGELQGQQVIIEGSFVLEDSNGGEWLLGVNALGELTTALVTGSPVELFLNFGGTQTWQVGVTPGGLLTTTNAGSISAPQFIILRDPTGQEWEVFVNSQGLLQDRPISIFIWVPNGFGAGTDNIIVGGRGGYMAYPQPAVPGGPTPEDDGQFGPLEFVYNSATATAAGNYFVISNPGRN